MPSSSRSPIATDKGRRPVAKSWRVWKVPSPLPSSTLTVLEEKFATARSGVPSPLRSPIATEKGLMPVAKFWFCPKKSPGSHWAWAGVAVSNTAAAAKTVGWAWANRFFISLLPVLLA